jgi:hypothetical protein
MAADTQFTALGESSGTEVGFQTSSTDIRQGVNVQGNRCGVYGESLQNSPPGGRPAKDRTGVYGTGDLYGVYGISNAFANDNQGDNTPGFADGNGIGVVGASQDVPGIVGASDIFPSDAATTPIRQLAHSPIGVLGISRKGAGVAGFSSEGRLSLPPEVRNLAATLHGAGVFGLGQSSRGGVFASGQQNVAQLQLVPKETPPDPTGALPPLPGDGQPGDLLALHDPSQKPPTSLWFCVQAGPGAFWSPIQLGSPVLGTQ